MQADTLKMRRNRLGEKQRESVQGQQWHIGKSQKARKSLLVIFKEMKEHWCGWSIANKRVLLDERKENQGPA